MSEPPDEFAWIECLRPLTRGDPRALGLRDDAAVIPSRPGYDLVVSTDAMVEGVHFLAGEAPRTIARRLLRASLSDLAAKAAEPFAYLLTTAWPADRDWADRHAFVRGLDEDGKRFAVVLLGGDTVSTAGPLVLDATVFGWAKAGKVVPRSGAKAGDALVVCGSIGDGWLGWRAAKGEIGDPGGRLAARYRLPMPLLSLRSALQTHAHAAADISDGLLADVAHIGRASGLAVSVDVMKAPMSPEAEAWLFDQPDRAAARLAMAGGGDDYAIACAVNPADETAFIAAVQELAVPVATLGCFKTGAGLNVTAAGVEIHPDNLGWRH